MRDATRTVDDEAAAALAGIEAAQRELENWREHVLRARRSGEPGVAHQARRSAQIVSGCVSEAVAHTAELVHRVERTSFRLTPAR